ncbi:MAG: DsbC family protein [Thermodesulfobacteria bacterium]|nr:DsbC family protein [Thermodesulfobacteriota bacterium]
MKHFTKWLPLFLLLMAGLYLSFATVVEAAEQSCPTKQALEKAIQQTFRQRLEIVDVKPADLPGLCQIQIKFRNQRRLIYSDSKGNYLIAGQLFSTKSGKNLTREAMTEINKLSKEELKKLDELAAFTLGDKGPVVYFVTDPHCPYCKKAEQIIEPLAKAGKVRVKYILFPLKFHKGAKEECISIICDNKGLEGFRNRYRSDNQCEKGKKKVEEAMNFLMSKGINGTPTYIFPDGRYHSGVMDRKALEARLAKFK